MSQDPTSCDIFCSWLKPEYYLFFSLGCSPVRCRRNCPFGWATDEDGCDMCKCKRKGNRHTKTVNKCTITYKNSLWFRVRMVYCLR